mmetsp:Transcript_17728/g.2905  ORF Transcript_17728/g.2905 Transcript_17728/m.2905 type:complete len:81 (-) Transcript_17728:691-933(-)
MDNFGTIDAFFEIEYGGFKNTTIPITADKSTMTSNIYQRIGIPIVQPNVSNKLLITLYDKDAFRSEMVGTVLFDLKEVLT